MFSPPSVIVRRPLWGAAACAAGAILLGIVAGSPAPASGQAANPIVAAAGDIACDPNDPYFNDGLGEGEHCRQLATSKLLVGRPLSAVLALGDQQYRDGRLRAFRRSYKPSWGRLRAITRPVPGNHEYLNPGAPGYWRYFNGDATTGRAGTTGEGYYSFDIGDWHLIALNSNCQQVHCGPSSAQLRWLEDDLDAHPGGCVLAYWHHPLFSGGNEGGTNRFGVRAFWRALHAAGADVIINGHDHDYERFAPRAPSGSLDRDGGIRQFVVGTGGKNLEGWRTWARYTEARSNRAFGVLKLTLRPGSYKWRFAPVRPARFADSGQADCH